MNLNRDDISIWPKLAGDILPGTYSNDELRIGWALRQKELERQLQILTSGEIMGGKIEDEFGAIKDKKKPFGEVATGRDAPPVPFGDYSASETAEILRDPSTSTLQKTAALWSLFCWGMLILMLFILICFGFAVFVQGWSPKG